MTRPEPAWRRVRLALTISTPASSMLDELLRTGLYGRTRAEVAQRLLYLALRGEEVARRRATNK